MTWREESTFGHLEGEPFLDIVRQHIGRPEVECGAALRPEEWAKLTSWLLRSVSGRFQLEFDLTHVDRGSQDILRIISQRANLR
jgi:hypothetical protein